MEVCPVGFFCFDKNTFILLIVAIIVVIVYYINNNSNKFLIEKQKFEENKNEFAELKNELEKTNNTIKQLKSENTTSEIIDNAIRINDFNDAQYLVDKDFQRVVNPLVAPERSFPYRINRIGVPINIPTRGVSSGYQQVGALIQEGDDSNKKILPLFGMPTYPGSRQWLYYTGNDSYASVKLPVEHSGRSCQDDHGCSEIYDGDEITVSGYNSKFKVNLYNLDKPRYLPNVL